MTTPAITFDDLRGRGVGLTGGGGHLGSALALGLAQAGAIVVICGRNVESLDTVVSAAEKESFPGRVVAQQADVSNDAQVAAVLDRVESEAGDVYGWINNACGSASEPLLELTREKVEASVGSGLTDTMLATRAAAERMLSGEAAGGSIVNMASMYGLVSPQPAAYADFPAHHNPAAYGAAKAGVLQFTRYAACHLAPRGVRVNCLSPGPFPRDEVRARRAFTTELCRRVPMGRVGEAPEIVGPALFLLSSASSFITGHNLVVDGGWTAW